MPSARLPIFPLPLVLFPGATLPLHIFEPRYRRLIADCQAGDGRFGIVLAGAGPERALPAGHVGCVAELREVDTLPDGRSNVVVEGAERFALLGLVDDPAPYHVAEVEPFGDRADADGGAEATGLAERLRRVFARIAHAARTIADEPGTGAPLPDDPSALSFHVAAAVDLELGTRQRLLASTSAAARLRELTALLDRAVAGVEERAAVHTRARSNGHGPVAPGGHA